VTRPRYRFGPVRHRSEQYRTSAHTFAHFFRHANGRPQAEHTFVGRSAFRTGFAITHPSRLCCRRAGGLAKCPGPGNPRAETRGRVL
jgi:hypothetical protein